MACAGLVTGMGMVTMGGDGVVLVVESQGKEGGSGSNESMWKVEVCGH